MRILSKIRNLPHSGPFLLRRYMRLTVAAGRHVRSSLFVRYSGGPLRLHLGCGHKRLNGFINIDHNLSPATDYVCDICRLPFRRNSAERIETYHVIEHIPHQIAPMALSHWRDILKPGGVLVIECPDFDRDIQEYLAGNEERLWSVFGRQRFPGDTHYFGYNAKRLTALLKSVGFGTVTEMPARDDHAKNEPCMRLECQKPLN